MAWQTGTTCGMPAAPLVATRHTRSSRTNASTFFVNRTALRRAMDISRLALGACGFQGGVGRAPALDAPDILGLDRADLLEEGAGVDVECRVERVGRDDLVRLGLAHQPRGQVQRLTDEAHVRARERSPGQQPERAHADSDVDAARGLHAIE